MTTDLLAAALAQLATVMIAVWSATEILGNWRGWNKLAVSLGLGPMFSTTAYALGWFTALPTVATARQIPLTGIRGYCAAAFAGLIATLATKAAHDYIIKPGMASTP